MTFRLLDLFCCQGGASRGYADAGFDVLGVDIDPQPLYPFTFIQADALEYLEAHGREFDAIHASPPCQASTSMSNRWRGKGGKADSWTSLIIPTREALIASGKPWILENVAGARREMVDPIILRGGMFDLGVDRPRLFDSSFALAVPKSRRVANPIGVYGETHDGRRLYTRKDGSIQRAAKSLEEARDAMGMPWADWDGCREAIPPAYTQYLGYQLATHLQLLAYVAERDAA